MSEGTEQERVVRYLVPQALMHHPHLVWQMMDQVIGGNVREKAHQIWHETVGSDALSTTEKTVRYAQIQAFLDYADEVDPTNTETTDKLLEHFKWKFLTDGDPNDGSN